MFPKESWLSLLNNQHLSRYTGIFRLEVSVQPPRSQLRRVRWPRALVTRLAQCDVFHHPLSLSDLLLER